VQFLSKIETGIAFGKALTSPIHGAAAPDLCSGGRPAGLWSPQIDPVPFDERSMAKIRKYPFKVKVVKESLRKLTY